MSLSSVASSLWTHKEEILAAVAGVVAGASLFIKALEVLVSALVVVFPSFQEVDGELKSVAAWLDNLSKSSWLNAVALSPKAAKALLMSVLAAAMLTAAPAQAQVLVSHGPTVPLMEVRPGNLHPVSLAAGAGYQLSFTMPEFQRAFGGKAWDLFDLNLMAFGSAVSSTSGTPFGAFSAALGVCTLSSLFCVGGGHDIATAPGLKPDWFAVFTFSVNFGTAPTVPPMGTEKGTLGLQRGNTLYWGAP